MYKTEKLEAYLSSGVSIWDESVRRHVPGPVAFLRHSHQHWVIGGAPEVRALIADLRGVLARMESCQKET